MRFPVVILIHGFNVTNPELTVGRLRDQFLKLGCGVETLSYGYIPLPIQASIINQRVARNLCAIVSDWQDKGHPVIVVGHSNGCAIIRLASDMGMTVNRAVCINPALDKDTHPCPGADSVHVWHNDGDDAVVLGAILSFLNSGLPFIGSLITRSRPWGAMGKYGYLGSSARVKNFDTGKDFLPAQALGHSAVFRDSAFVSEIARLSAIL